MTQRYPHRNDSQELISINDLGNKSYFEELLDAAKWLLHFDYSESEVVVHLVEKGVDYWISFFAVKGAKILLKKL